MQIVILAFLINVILTLPTLEGFANHLIAADSCPVACSTSLEQFKRESTQKHENLKSIVLSLSREKPMFLNKIDKLTKKYEDIKKANKHLKLRIKKVWRVAMANRKKCAKYVDELKDELNKTRQEVNEIRQLSELQSPPKPIVRNVTEQEPTWDYCIDSNGRKRMPNEEWSNLDRKGNPTLCSCSSLFFGKGGLFPSCKILGCYAKDVYYRPGEKQTDCTCVNGTDPYLMDAYTLYHWQCTGLSDEYCTDSEGMRRMRNERWRKLDSKGNPQLCTCDSAVFGLPGLYPGCRLIGCYGKEGVYYSPWESRNACTCVNGTDPYLADDYTLFHWQCQDGGSAAVPTLGSCHDHNGVLRNTTEEWSSVSPTGFAEKCRCVPMHPGGPVYPDCKIAGCEYNSTLYQLGSSPSGLNCICMEGSDPDNQDDSNLYHWSCDPDRLMGCKDKFGILHDYMKTWNQTDQFGNPLSCSCDTNVFAHGLYAQCRLVGCTYREKYFKPGSISPDNRCECKRGPDVNLMDFATLYHWSCAQETRTCTDKNGVERMYGIDWKDVNDNGNPLMCQCVTPFFTRGLVAQCRLKGCEYNNTFYFPGSSHSNGRCQCTQGSDPDLMDASTLYHWTCDEPKANVTFVSYERPAQERRPGAPSVCTCTKFVYGKMPSMISSKKGCEKDGRYYDPGAVLDKCLCILARAGTALSEAYVWLCRDVDKMQFN